MIRQEKGLKRNTEITEVILVVGAISIIGFSTQNVFAIGQEESMMLTNNFIISFRI